VVVELPGSVVVVVDVVVVELELVLVVVVVVWQGSVVVVLDPVVGGRVVDDGRVVVVRSVVAGRRLVVDAWVVAVVAAEPVVLEVPGPAADPVGAPTPTVTPPSYRRAQPRTAST
jgi:hypothetical protein